MKYLSEGLKVNTTLTRLYLSFNKFKDNKYINMINNKTNKNKIYQENRQKENIKLLKLPLYLSKSYIFINKDLQYDLNTFLTQII